jgi:hypothetical protein
MLEANWAVPWRSAVQFLRGFSVQFTERQSGTIAAAECLKWITFFQGRQLKWRAICWDEDNKGFEMVGYWPPVRKKSPSLLFSTFKRRVNNFERLPYILTLRNLCPYFFETRFSLSSACNLSSPRNARNPFSVPQNSASFLQKGERRILFLHPRIPRSDHFKDWSWCFNFTKLFYIFLLRTGRKISTRCRSLSVSPHFSRTCQYTPLLHSRLSVALLRSTWNFVNVHSFFPSSSLYYEHTQYVWAYLTILKCTSCAFKVTAVLILYSDFRRDFSVGDMV